MTYKTEQEKFWAGDFGNEYIKRNGMENGIANNVAFFSKILAHTTGISSVIEFGANIGLNLHAIRALLPDASLSAVEINEQAAKELRASGIKNVFCTSILDYSLREQYDFSLIKGVLIHINPAELQTVYEKLYNSSGKYICIAEYYNPSPIAISYRGHSDRLFKRDFAGEMLDKYRDLKLIDYGFSYHRDTFPQDDVTWFLLQKI